MQRLLGSALLFAAATSLHAQDIALSKVLVPKDSWREVATGFPNLTFLEPEKGDILLFRNDLLGRLSPTGKFTAERMPLVRRPDVLLAEDGPFYIVDEDKKAVRWIKEDGKSESLKLPGLRDPNCLLFWPDHGHLVIGENDGPWMWAVRIEKDGSFGPGDRYYSLRTASGQATRVRAMIMDAGYLLYACTPLGIQVFDPTGRLSGVIAPPAQGEMTAITIGGPAADTLFVTCGDRIFARRIQGKAAYTLGQK